MVMVLAGALGLVISLGPMGCSPQAGAPAHRIELAGREDHVSLEHEGRFMSLNEVKLKNVEEIVRLAQMSASGAVADEFRQSLPIPIREAEGLRLAFFFCPALARPGQPVQLGPPQYVIRLDAATGGMLELRKVEPKDFQQSHNPGDIIGTFGMPAGLTTEEFMARRAALYKAYDALLPEFAAGRSRVSPDIKSQAVDFQKMFSLLSEPPLRPYYQATGKDFFKWLDYVVH
jgi:hypothetical protein